MCRTSTKISVDADLVGVLVGCQSARSTLLTKNVTEIIISLVQKNKRKTLEELGDNDVQLI